MVASWSEPPEVTRRTAAVVSEPVQDESSPMRTRDRVEVWRSLMEVHGVVLAEIERQLRAAHQLTAREFDALINIPEAGVQMKDLTGRVLLSQSATSRLIARLQQRGLVSRSEVAGDSRAALLHLTGTGQALVREAAHTNAAAMDAALGSKLTAAEMRTLGRLMDKARTS
jgi:DNA-binding MarR family transcriptional regulator